jgi:hypothetical protein
MVERECSCLHRLNMTGTDEHRNSHSHSGTPSREHDVVPQPDSRSHSGASQGFDPQPVFQPSIGYVNPPQVAHPPPPPMCDDLSRMYIPAQHELGFINLNDDVPMVQNAPLQNMGPLSQEGGRFQWQLPHALHIPM